MVESLIKLEAEVKSSTAKINTLQDVAGEYYKKLEDLPVKVLGLARLERQRLVDEQTYVMMTKKLEETKISEAGQRKNVRIIDEAVEPGEPTKPKKNLLLSISLPIWTSFQRS